MKQLTLFMLILAVLPVFGQSIYVPNSDNINTGANQHTYLKFKRSGNYLYVSFDKYFTGDNSQYPENYAGTKYYVSSTGNNSNNGLTKNTAVLTIKKALTLASNAGDAILLKSTDSFASQDTFIYSGNSTNPITIGAYGVTTSKPKIYGSVPITNWTKRGGSNIYVTSFTPAAGQSDITQLFVNGQRQRLARYPNTGYLLLTSVASTTQFGIAAINQNVAGSTAFLRPFSYMSEVRTVSTNTDTTITIASAVSEQAMEKKEGVFFMNKLEFIDSPGEWYYNPSNDSVYFWAAGNVDPDTFADVRGSVYSNGLVSTSKAYITIRDLEILHQKTNGINMGAAGSLYVTIQNNTIDGQDAYGIYSISGSNWTIDGNTITNQNGGGIWTSNWDNSTIKNNLIRKTAIFEAIGILGTSANIGGSAIEASGTSGKTNLIQYNEIDSAGYNGIFWRFQTFVQNNLIKNTCLTKSDGGAIYTGSATVSGSRIEFNIIDSVYGNPSGTKTVGEDNGRMYGFGIYIDQNSIGVQAVGNTVLRCSEGAIFLHYPNNHIVSNNLTFSNRYGWTTNQAATGTSVISLNTFISGRATDPDPFNKFLKYEPRQLMAYHRTTTGTGTVNFETNKYISGFTGVSSDTVFRIATGAYRDLSGWQSYTTKDAGSTYNSGLAKLALGEEQKVIYNASKLPRTYKLNSATGVKDESGNTITISFTLIPYGSKYVRGFNLSQIQ